MKEKLRVLPTILLLGYVAFMVVYYNVKEEPQPVKDNSVDETSEVLTAPDYTEPEVFETYVESQGTDLCTDDCSGHEAGYKWARENDVCDPYFDGGNSQSFAEGVIAYAYDNCYYSDDGEPI